MVKNRKNSPPAALLVKIQSFYPGWEVSRNRKFGTKKWTLLGSVRTLPLLRTASSGFHLRPIWPQKGGEGVKGGVDPPEKMDNFAHKNCAAGGDFFFNVF